MILDMDETLIHATGRLLDSPDFTVGAYNVYRRPHLDEFLTTCSEFYDLAIWSSGGSDYVQAVVANIIPPNIQPVFIWCRDRCTRRTNPETQDQCFLKDLKKVKREGFDLDRVLIVEDTAENVQRNYGNALYVTSYVGQAGDMELLLLGQYLASIHAVQNVRKLEKRGWRSCQASGSVEAQ
ncbi:MAG: HAD family hydrolase [Thermoguttaceae bacterium]